jgi:hypothetical protein
MLIHLQPQHYSTHQRQALWWVTRGSTYKGNPSLCPTATIDECQRHLEAVGHSQDDDLDDQWSRAISRYDSKINTTTMTKTKPIPALYVFNWVGGGYNSAYASTRREAMAEVARKFPGMEVEKTSIRRLATRAQQDAYYKSLPLWD